MPERVPAQLEAIIGEPLHLLKPPLPVLAAILGCVAEEVVPRLSAIEHAEGRSILPTGMRFLEVEPDPQGACRIDRQLAAVLDVAELLGRRVEDDNDRRHAGWNVAEILVEHL